MILIDNIIHFGEGNIQKIDKIPAGNWLVKFDEMKESYFLEKIKDFTLPTKIYGDPYRLAKRYIDTFNKYDKNLGIALTGLKGTGKSLTSKAVCVESKLPVIVIDRPHHGTAFNSFISSINQKAIVFIDEFEKVYEDKLIQQQLLSLLDGVFHGNKMFIFTSNEMSHYNNHLMNRPGRIHYMKNFDRIDSDTLEEIIDDKLINKSNKKELINVLDLIDEANIDMVVSLIREMNDYDETAKESIKFLNINISDKGSYKMKLIKNGFVYETRINRNPLFVGAINASFSINETDSEELGRTKDEIDEIYNRDNSYVSIDESLKDWSIKTNSSGSVMKSPKKDMVCYLEKVQAYNYVF